MLQASYPQPGWHRRAQPGTAGGKLCGGLSPRLLPKIKASLKHSSPLPVSPITRSQQGSESLLPRHLAWRQRAPACCPEKQGSPSTLILLVSSLSCCLTQPCLYVCSPSYSPNLFSIPRELKKGGFSPIPFSTPLRASWERWGRTQRGQTHLAKVSGLEARPRFLASGQALTTAGSRAGLCRHRSLLGHLQGHGGHVACPAVPCVGSPGAAVLRQLMGRSKKNLEGLFSKWWRV